MQIINEAARQQSASNRQTSNKSDKPKKASGSHAAAGESTTFSRLAKAAALGVLAGPAVAMARQTPGTVPAGLALPTQSGQALSNPGPAHTSRQLLQSSGCGCNLLTTGGAVTLTTGPGYSKVTMSTGHSPNNLVVVPTQGSTVDVYGFGTGDGVSFITPQNMNWLAQENSDSSGMYILVYPLGATPSVTPRTFNSTYVDLHGFPYASFDSSINAHFNAAQTYGQCTSNGVAGGTVNCSPPPPVTIVVPLSPSPSPSPSSSPPPPPSPVFAPPPPPPSPVFASPPPPPPPPPPHGGSGAGAAIGGIAGGVVGVGVIAAVAGTCWYKKRHVPATLPPALSNEGGVVEMSPYTGPIAPEAAAAPDQDFQD